MKYSLSAFVFLLLFPGVMSFAQEETLMGSGEIENGGFGALVIKFTQIKNEGAVLVGGRGGWIINHSFVIGGGGYGLVNKIEGNTLYYGEKPLLNFGYGGLELEYIMKSDRLVHVSVNSLIGGGAVTYRSQWEWYGGDTGNFNHDQFFVFEPGVNVEVNITSFFRMNAGASYRFISGGSLDDLKNTDLAGPSALVTFKFGKF